MGFLIFFNSVLSLKIIYSLASLIGSDTDDQSKVDQILLELDGTKNKSKLGANAILAVSMANMVAYAKSSKKYVYELIPNIYGDPSLPVPFMNILNGGAHADGVNVLSDEYPNP